MNLEPIRALLELAEKATGGNWLVRECKTPWTHPAVPEYGLSESKGEHIEYWVLTDWEHPQLKGPLAVNGIGTGLGNEGGPAAQLIAMSKEDAEFISCARNSVPALSQLLEAVTNLEKLEQDLRTMAARELHLNGEASKDLLTQYADDLKRLLHPEDK